MTNQIIEQVVDPSVKLHLETILYYKLNYTVWSVVAFLGAASSFIYHLYIKKQMKSNPSREGDYLFRCILSIIICILAVVCFIGVFRDLLWTIYTPDAFINHLNPPNKL